MRPTRGASTIEMIVDIHFSPRGGMAPMMGQCNFGSSISTCHPPRAIAAPASPPMRAWDDEVGSPHHQVSKSQMMAPVRAERITYCVTCSGCTRPLLMVFATAVPKTKAAMKLKAAAQTTASLGESTLVDTTVAMLLAAS